MKAKDLIKNLKDLDPDTDVIIGEYGCTWGCGISSAGMGSVELTEDTEAGKYYGNDLFPENEDTEAGSMKKVFILYQES